jgi:NADP-dependent 3-hydroxy acid dehydrogenase YdfG
VELKDAVTVVTGASAGIGRATALALARAGADVVLAARRESRLQDLATEIEGLGRRALVVRCDVAERADLEALAERVERELGGADVLVNNAGIPGGGSFAKLSLDQIERVVRTNELSVLWATRLFLPKMLERRKGHVVNIASVAGRYAVPGSAVYTAGKHAVVAFSEALFFELQERGVLVTAVNPAFVATEGFPHLDKPPRLVMQPERIADVVVDVIRKGTAPEISVPRWIGPPGQALRVLAPPLYRAGMRRAARSGLARPHEAN